MNSQNLIPALIPPKYVDPQELDEQKDRCALMYVQLMYKLVDILQ